MIGYRDPLEHTDRQIDKIGLHLKLYFVSIIHYNCYCSAVWLLEHLWMFSYLFYLGSCDNDTWKGWTISFKYEYVQRTCPDYCGTFLPCSQHKVSPLYLRRWDSLPFFRTFSELYILAEVSCFVTFPPKILTYIRENFVAHNLECTVYQFIVHCLIS